MNTNFLSFNKKIQIKKKKIKINYIGHTSKTFGYKQIEFYRKRLERVRLTWCQQVLEILNKMNFMNPKINDLGCNYFGYDIDKKFISLGLSKFPELKKKHKITNIENASLRKSDISIISDTLEITEKPEKIIKNIISSTKKVVILRTFLSTKEKVQVVKNSKFLSVPYFINCFSYNMIIDYFLKNNFFPQIYPDLATNLSEVNEIFPNVRRRFYIVVFSKKKFLLKDFKTKIHKKLFSYKD